MILRKAKFRDYVRLKRLTDQDGWNYSEEDFSIFEETGCSETIVAVDDEGIIGMMTLFDYGGTGWISNLLVSKEWRETGVGEELLSKGLEIFEKKRTVSLFSTKEALDFYLKRGFNLEREFHFVRFRGGKTGTAEESGHQDVFHMDRECFGYDREGVLRVLIKRGKVLYPSRGRGFAILRPNPRELAVGPVISWDKKAGLDLLYNSLSFLGANATAVLPSLDIAGVEEIYKVFRLYRGERPRTDYRRVFAFAGLEFG